MTLSLWTLKTVTSRILTLSTYLRTIVSYRCYLYVGICWCTNVRIYKFTRLFWFARFARLTSSSASTSLIRLNICTILGFFSNHIFSHLSFCLCLSLLLTWNDWSDVCRTKTKNIGLFILISPFFIRIMPQIIVNNCWKGRISCSRAQLSSTNNALSFLFVY